MQIMHCLKFMRRKFIVLSLSILGILPVFAQDNNFTTNQLSLADCISLALEHNFDVQIAKINPEISRYSLNMAYASYEPSFYFSAQQSYNKMEGSSDISTYTPPPNETWREAFQSGISGLAPWGLRYDLSGSVNRSSGTRPDMFGNIVDRGFEYNSDAAITLSQPLLKNFWIDQPRMTIQVNKRNLKISQLAFQQQVMTTITSVEQAYYDLIYAMENVKVQEKALQLAEELLAENKKRVQVGAMAPLDEKQAESQVASSKASLLISLQTLSNQQNALKKLISEEFLKWKNVFIQPTEQLNAIPMAFSLTDSWNKGLTQRPDIVQMRTELEKRDIQIKYYKNQLFPQLDLRGSYGRSGVDRTLGGALDDINVERDPHFSYGIVLNIPLGNTTARNNYKSARAQRQQYLLQLKQLEQNIMVAIDDAIKQAQTSLQRVEATKQAREYAEAALKAEQKKLESGKSTSFVVLQLQRDLTSARSEEIRALADYNKALAQLSLVEGSTLERHNIKLDFK